MRPIHKEILYGLCLENACPSLVKKFPHPTEPKDSLLCSQPALVPILRQINPVHAIPSSRFNTAFKNIFFFISSVINYALCYYRRFITTI